MSEPAHTNQDNSHLDFGWIKTEAGSALAHANSQINALFRTMREWAEEHPLTMSARLDRRGRSVTFVLDELTDAPLQIWTQQAGDALHNYRRVLDSIAWDLAERHAIRPLSSQQRASIKFPLAKSREEFDAAAKNPRNWLSSIDSERVRRLSTTQPFVATNPKQSILKWLADLDNTRKHRGGFHLRRVVDHVTGFFYFDLADEAGNDVAPTEASIHLLSRNRDVIAGLPVAVIHHRGIARARSTEPVRDCFRINRGDDESDLEELLLALNQQIVATVMVIYTGHFPPPGYFNDLGSPFEQAGWSINQTGNRGSDTGTGNSSD